MKPAKPVILAAMICLMIVAGVGCPKVVSIKDEALASAIKAELGKPFSLLLTDADLAQIKSLDASNLNIKYLSGLEYCKNLAWLDLHGNVISDLTPLSELGRPTSPLESPLQFLDISGNDVMDITPLAGVLNLRVLAITGNPIKDLSPLVTNSRNGGLGEGDTVMLDSDTLATESLERDIPALQALRVNIVTSETSSGTTSDTSGSEDSGTAQ